MQIPPLGLCRSEGGGHGWGKKRARPRGEEERKDGEGKKRSAREHGE